ncbi:hypothetical protein PS910_03876 [Pseudomonas fluorescens]|nr:hypothetical protein PS910_03876 [Pseudomonas fluorescens]
MSRLLERHLPAFAAQVSEWQARWASSLGRRWLKAWLAELTAVLPPALAARLGNAATEQLLPWPLPGQCEPGRPAILLLSAHQVLLQRISLPIAATRNLKEVLTYEVDRYTPYTAEQVHFVARVLRKQPPNAEVELVAIARTALELMLETCRERGVQVIAIDATNAAGERLRIDLLPAGAGPSLARPATLNRWLWLGCVACTVVLAAAGLDHRQTMLEAMQRELAAQRLDVQRVQQLRQTLDDTLGASTYLAKLKAQRPTLAWVLADLSSCLGDDTWVEHLEVRDGVQVTFSGQSARASALLSQVKACPTLHDAQFQGIIQTDKATGRERFSISAQLSQESLHASTQ